MLTHYTGSIRAVVGILTHGFAWVPNRRHLTTTLLPGYDYSKRDPQQFGMISFTEIEPQNATAHCAVFGHFGIVVSEAWALSRGAQRIIYVEDSGPATEAWQGIFGIGYHDLKARIKYPDDGAWLMSFENKAMARAVAGAALWSNLLQLYEYMEPSSSAAQREWRIVNSSPDYSVFGPKEQIIAAVSPPQNWAKFTRVLPIAASDVHAIVSPRTQLEELKQLLPSEYKNAQFVVTEG